MNLVKLVIALAALAMAGCSIRTSSSSGDRSGTQGVSCLPGATYEVACGAYGLGYCEGDPRISVCSGDVSVSSCGSVGSLASNDDRTGYCPGVTVTCPASGEFTISHERVGFGSYVCDWDLNRLSAP